METDKASKNYLTLMSAALCPQALPGHTKPRRLIGTFILFANSCTPFSISMYLLFDRFWVTSPITPRTDYCQLLSRRDYVFCFIVPEPDDVKLFSDAIHTITALAEKGFIED